MKTLFFLVLCAVTLIPDATLAQRRCDGGGKLTSYVSGARIAVTGGNPIL